MFRGIVKRVHPSKFQKVEIYHKYNIFPYAYHIIGNSKKDIFVIRATNEILAFSKENI